MMHNQPGIKLCSCGNGQLAIYFCHKTPCCNGKQIFYCPSCGRQHDHY